MTGVAVKVYVVRDPTVEKASAIDTDAGEGGDIVKGIRLVVPVAVVLARQPPAVVAVTE